MLFKTLNNNTKIPVIGIGTWNAEKGKVGEVVEYAITKAGYKHIDCASIYENEKEIGETLSKTFKSNIKREDIYITSKLWNTDHKPENVEIACRKTLNDLQLDYLDLYLVHWAIPFIHGENLEPMDKDGYVKLDKVPMKDTWSAMENLVSKGLVKSIGISNFNTTLITELLTYAKIKPVINQIEVHPYNSQARLIEYSKHLDIETTAYSPLGTPGIIKKDQRKLLEDKVIIEMSKKYNKTPAQILLRWRIQRDTIVIPKSTSKERIDENINIFDFELSLEDFNKINDLNMNLRYVDPYQWYKIPYFD